MNGAAAGIEPAVTRVGAAAGGADRDPFPVEFPVVAIIASTGGVAALLRVLEPLPEDLAAVVLVALHQAPHRVNELARVLGRRTRLPVELAEPDMVMQPGVVLVVPPGRHLLVTSRARIALIETGSLPPARPSGDLLLATLAVTCGPRALAVVLTGYGHDAQAGVRAVVHCGGTVLAQDEATSAVFAMPEAAIATGKVSQVLALDDIAAAIMDLAAR
ncbi:chemotaxis protein CheB [Dactylosporangium sp. CS-047395]|uniref:chemotaxis protein CheB n=1 Tax=Dactylosporangium sp. CS-047395 TaxID=3239936 RepID=UPI003D933CBF